MSAQFEYHRLDLVADAHAAPGDLPQLDAGGAIVAFRGRLPANDESPNDAPAASAARAVAESPARGLLLPLSTSDLGAVPAWNSYALHLAAGEHRANLIREFAGRAVRAVGGWIAARRAAAAAARERAIVRATLRRLDARTLRDLGLHRSEIGLIPREAVFAGSTRDCSHG